MICNIPMFSLAMNWKHLNTSFGSMIVKPRSNCYVYVKQVGETQVDFKLIELYTVNTGRRRK